MKKAVIETAKRFVFGAPTLLETQLANEIVEMYDNIDKVRFVSSGTEAVMSAIRLARGVTGKMTLWNLKVVIMDTLIHF